MMIQEIELERIQTDETQTRAHIRPEAVAEYAELIRNGTELEAAVVYEVNGQLHLAAGMHRREAYRAAGRIRMPCEVRTGTLWDAVEFGIRDNRKHVGERLTTADKTCAIRLVLQKRPELSNTAIAELCGVSDKTVAKHRRDLELTSEIPESAVRTGRDGRTIHTAAIGCQSDRTGSGANSTLMLPPDWEPSRWRKSTLDSRRENCQKWWDMLAASVLYLAEVGWDAERIAAYLGVRLDVDVRPILNPIPPQRALAEFEEISQRGAPLMSVYGKVVQQIIHFWLETACWNAESYAESDDLDDVATLLRNKSTEHGRLSKSLPSSVWPGPPHDEIADVCTATDCCALQDARLALGIEVDVERLERTQQALKTNFELHSEILQQRRSETESTPGRSSSPST